MSRRNLLNLGVSQVRSFERYLIVRGTGGFIFEGTLLFLDGNFTEYVSVTVRVGDVTSRRGRRTFGNCEVTSEGG